jgi:hypothetical protein
MKKPMKRAHSSSKIEMSKISTDEVSRDINNAII